MQTSGTGYTTKLEGNKLTIVIEDVTMTHGFSKSGKSQTIATTGAAQTVGPDNLKLGLNVYRPR